MNISVSIDFLQLKSAVAQCDANEKFPDLQEGDVESALNCILGQMSDALVHGVPSKN